MFQFNAYIADKKPRFFESSNKRPMKPKLKIHEHQKLPLRIFHLVLCTVSPNQWKLSMCFFKKKPGEHGLPKKLGKK